MIIRIFRAQVHPGHEVEYEQLIREDAPPGLAAQPGMVSVHFGRSLAGSPAEYTIVSLWQDRTSLQAFAGDDWQGLVELPDEDPLVASQSVQVYESLENANQANDAPATSAA
jgi:heme-degrading monooxygenase HmoA